MKPMKGTEAISHQRALVRVFANSRWETSTTAQIVSRKNGTHSARKTASDFKSITQPFKRSVTLRMASTYSLLWLY